MLILAQFCKWASCYNQTTFAICAVNFYFYRSNNMSLGPYKGEIVCKDKAGSEYGVCRGVICKICLTNHIRNVLISIKGRGSRNVIMSWGGGGLSEIQPKS